jgi:L-arabinose isomerase
MLRAGLPVHQVTGVLGDEATWAEIDGWIEAARVKKTLADNRLGLMGHYYNGMLDIVTDLTQVSITFGSHIEQLEVDELSGLRAGVSDAEIAARVADFRTTFEVQPDCAESELQRAARTSVALDRLVAERELTSMAYYYMGSGVPENEDTMSSVILGTSLLTARGVPVAGEYEVKNALAMKIMDCLGAGGSFTEYYGLDLEADHVLMGHDGPGHLAIAESKTKVRPLDVYHGKVGRGLSVEMSVKRGPVTLLSVAEDRARGFKLLVAEGESVAGEVLRIGNTNSHYRFSVGARGFVEAWNAEGPAHHCAIGVGHLGAKLRKLAALLELPLVQVC